MTQRQAKTQRRRKKFGEQYQPGGPNQGYRLGLEGVNFPGNRGDGRLWNTEKIVVTTENVTFPVAAPFHCAVNGLIHVAATGGKRLFLRCQDDDVNFRGARLTEESITCIACLALGPLHE